MTFNSSGWRATLLEQGDTLGSNVLKWVIVTIPFEFETVKNPSNCRPLGGDMWNFSAQTPWTCLHWADKLSKRCLFFSLKKRSSQQDRNIMRATSSPLADSWSKQRSVTFSSDVRWWAWLELACWKEICHNQGEKKSSTFSAKWPVYLGRYILKAMSLNGLCQGCREYDARFWCHCWCDWNLL